MLKTISGPTVHLGSLGGGDEEERTEKRQVSPVTFVTLSSSLLRGDAQERNLEPVVSGRQPLCI